MRFIVVGCGSIGGRHIRNLLNLKQEVAGFDPFPEARMQTEKELGVKTYADLESAFDFGADAALICTTTSEHINIAAKAASKGLHLFIEKPLSHNMEGVDSLIKTLEKKQLVSFMGFNMRYNANLGRIKEHIDSGKIGRILGCRVHFGTYLPDRHPGKDYRKDYGAIKSKGGGVILDAIHQIDYVSWFLGEAEEVYCVAGKKSSLEIDVEDYAEILLKFGGGATASINLNYVQRPYQNSCEIIGERGTITWALKLDFDVKNRQYTYASDEMRLYDVGTGVWRTTMGDKSLDEQYAREMKHFIECVEKKENPKTDALHGKQMLKIALAAKESAEKNKTIKVKK